MKFSTSRIVGCGAWNARMKDMKCQTIDYLLWFRCTVSKGEVIGPYLFKNRNMTRKIYKMLLLYLAVSKLIKYPGETNLKHHGAPPHFAVLVHQYLGPKYRNWWIERAVPISWLPCSPDLTPCDYFSREQFKYFVYHGLSNTISELMAKNGHQGASIDEDI